MRINEQNIKVDAYFQAGVFVYVVVLVNVVVVVVVDGFSENAKTIYSTALWKIYSPGTPALINSNRFSFSRMRKLTLQPLRLV